MCFVSNKQILYFDFEKQNGALPIVYVDKSLDLIRSEDVKNITICHLW
jgi:hypothetical protein